jgi:hypothetical protein
MRKFAGALAIALMLNAPALAQFCGNGVIESVSENGATIYMRSGEVFSVDAGDQANTATWQAGDDVLLCNNQSEMINTQRNGEHATVAALLH